MNLSSTEAVILIGIMALCTFLTRALPFMLFPARRGLPAFVVELGGSLPCAVIGMLIVYCLKDVSFSSPPYGAPEAVSLAVVILLYLAAKNSLLAIAAGTALYVVLV
ncbi:MAG: AzlD domain-containing protein [Spirochaetales bacterium]|nr:AzlD domain-containing protein [Spirochaetales bacterium]